MRDPLSAGEFRLVGLTVFAIGLATIWLLSRITR
jgi:uncharacterized protein YjeT (DUF2065 family)